MKLLVLPISLILLFNVSVASAVVYCSAAVSGPNTRSFINKYRESRVVPLQPDMPKEVSGFLIKVKLGQSKAKAYLAIDPLTGKSVVVKTEATIAMFWRELLVTEYLLENGETVPRILKAYFKKDGTTVVIREYFKGITGSELKQLRDSAGGTAPAELTIDAWKLLDPEIDRLRQLYWKGGPNYPSFSRWYSSNIDKLEAKYQVIWNIIKQKSILDPELMDNINDFLFQPDFSQNNFLFEVQRNQWLAYDP